MQLAKLLFGQLQHNLGVEKENMTHDMEKQHLMQLAADANSVPDVESHICIKTNELNKCTSDGGSFHPIRHRKKSSFSKNFTEGQ